MSYGEYKFGDFSQYYKDNGPSDALVGFAEGFAKGFVPAYNAANQAARDEKTALAKIDRQAEHDAAKAKATANKKHSDDLTQAKAIVSSLAIPEGVNTNDVVMMAYSMLQGGVGDTSVFTTLSKSIEDGTLQYETKGSPKPTPEVPPAPVDDAPAAEPTPLEQEMNDAFGQQSSVQTEPTTTDVAEATTEPAPVENDGSYQTASLGNDWATDYANRREARINDGTEVQVAKLDTQTDVTNPDGLGGGSDKASTVVLAEGDGTTTPSERVQTTSRVLKINPAAKKAAASEVEVDKIDNYAKAVAAVTALTGVDTPEARDKLKRASFLMKQFTETPDIGKMNINELYAFMELTDPDAGIAPEYKNIDPQVMGSLRLYAKDFIQDLNNQSLPSLQETDPNKLRGIQADIKAGRIRTSGLYRDELASRITALDELAAAKKVEDLVFDEKYVEKLFFLERKRIFADSELTADEKTAAWDLWQKGEGAALQEILRAGDKPDAPQQINSIEEAAIVELMASDAYDKASKSERLDLIEQTKRFLEKTPDGSLTQANYADMVANYTLMLSSEDAAEVAEAKKWFATIAPALETGLQAGAKATARPGDPQKFQIRYTDEGGKTIKSDGVKVDGGYKLDSGAVVKQDNVLSVRSSESMTYINDQLSRTRTERNDQRESMVSLIDLTQQAYALEQIAVNDPVVLTLVGAGTGVVEKARNEARALVSLVTRIGEEAFTKNPNDTTAATNRLEQVLGEFISQNNITGQTADNYRKFAAKLTRFVFASGKALGQEGNGFSNQDYRNILGSLQAGNGIGAFVENLRGFVKERATFVDAGANSLKSLPEIQDLMEYQTDLGYSTMTFDEYSASEYAPVDYTKWLASPVPNASAPESKPKVILQQNENGVWTLPTNQ